MFPFFICMKVIILFSFSKTPLASDLDSSCWCSISNFMVTLEKSYLQTGNLSKMLYSFSVLYCLTKTAHRKNWTTWIVHRNTHVHAACGRKFCLPSSVPSTPAVAFPELFRGITWSQPWLLSNHLGQWTPCWLIHACAASFPLPFYLPHSLHFHG